MGKAKKKKFSAGKPRPTGLPSVAESEAEIELTQAADPASSTLQAVIEKLQSPNEENRESACTTIASFVSHPGAVQGLLKLNVVKILGPLVLDPSWDVRHRALGALRNLSVDGGQPVCDEMIHKDVMTPVLALISKFGSGDELSEKQSERQKTMICEAYSNTFYLLLYLCEGSDTAVKHFNRENLLPVICNILHTTQANLDLKVAVGEFLHTVTEDNADLCKPELVDCIQKLMSQPTTSSHELLLKTLATGVLVNVEGSRLSTASGDLVLPIVTSVAEVLATDVPAMLLQQNGASVNGNTDNVEGNTAENNKTALQKTEADIENLLKAQKVALEIAANLCCSDDDDWEDMNDSESSSDDTMDVAMDDTPGPGGDNLVPLCVSTELHTAYVKCDIVSKVLQTAQPLTTEQCQCLENLPNGKKIQKRFQVVQTHSLLCINNLVSSLDIEALGGVPKLHGVLTGLNQLATSASCREHQESLEAVTSAIRAVTQKIAEVDPSNFDSVSGSDLQYMCEMATKCQWSEVRVNSLRIISTIGNVLARKQTPHPLLKDIGVFLLEIVCKDSDLWVVAESLDSIFDVFGEDHVDPVLKEIGLVEKLKTVAPALKSKMHDNKKTLGEHYPVICMARTNLIRFIKYKMSR